ncbi:hypothetical protein Q7C36_005453 [Tachysurus vachellii]|uniref:Secreted protein n=1 Tax=Tachysurus vachellii TaxID=175792 RepID=A0AA88T820_TACVA|nr:hypothetical protein Q7C36_005453 [Tachysurus vachellii]
MPCLNERLSLILFIHTFILYRLSELPRVMCRSLCRSQVSRQETPWTECQPIAGHTHTHTLSFTHAITHYRQFSRDDNQPTMHVFGTGRKPPRHGKNMQTPHTQGGGGNQTPNPGVVRRTC